VAFVGDDHILSASEDHTLCVTQLSFSTVVARTWLRYRVKSVAAVCSDVGPAALIDAPAADAHIFKAHGGAAIPHGLAAMPVDARVLLEKVAIEFGVSMQGKRQILRETAQRMVGDRENGSPPVAVVLLGENGDKVEDREDAESSTGGLNGRDMEVLKGQFEATIQERLSALVACDAVDVSTPNAACDSTRAVGTSVGGHSNAEGAYREAVIFLLDVDECGTGAQRFSTALNTLRERSISAELVHMMDHTELAVSMAAHTVMYKQVRLSQFVKLRRCLLDTFIDVPVDGSLLVGDHAIPSDKLFNLIMNDLTSSNVSRSMARHEVTLRRCIDLVYHGSRE
jgi:hypothetical protein